MSSIRMGVLLGWWSGDWGASVVDLGGWKQGTGFGGRVEISAWALVVLVHALGGMSSKGIWYIGPGLELKCVLGTDYVVHQWGLVSFVLSMDRTIRRALEVKYLSPALIVS